MRSMPASRVERPASSPGLSNVRTLTTVHAPGTSWQLRGASETLMMSSDCDTSSYAAASARPAAVYPRTASNARSREMASSDTDESSERTLASANKAGGVRISSPGTRSATRSAWHFAASAASTTFSAVRSEFGAPPARASASCRRSAAFSCSSSSTRAASTPHKVHLPMCSVVLRRPGGVSDADCTRLRTEWTLARAAAAEWTQLASKIEFSARVLSSRLIEIRHGLPERKSALDNLFSYPDT